MDPLAQGFRLEGLQVSPSTGEIAGPGGTVKTDPRVMDVLVLMAAHPGQVMPREALVSRLWGQAVVTDDALTRCFYELRRHLAQAGGDERFRDLIETLPKRGYRLNAMVEPGAPPAPPPDFTVGESPRRPRAIVAAGAAAVVVVLAAAAFWMAGGRDGAATGPPAPRGIAVLPFMDMTEASDQGYLADGVAEEILNHLARYPNLRVIARTSSFALRAENLDVRSIGRRLDVDYVLEGSVRRAGERVRITAQLIDVASNAHAWSQTYDRGLDDLFAVQDEIAASVAGALQVELAQDPASPVVQPGFEAYEQYFLGQFFYHRRAPGDLERVVDHYRRAVAAEPRFAQAWAALSGAYFLRSERAPPDQQSWDLQGAAARQAVALDPNLAVAHARLAQYLFRTGQPDRARAHVRKAQALDPDDPLVLGMASAQAIQKGDFEAATDIWRRLAARDPMSATYRHNFGSFLLASGRPDEAIRELRTAVSLNPDGTGNRLELARALIVARRADEAAAIILQSPESLAREVTFALLARDPRHGPAARATLARLQVPPANIDLSLGLAEALAHSGDVDAAFDVLRAARAEAERRGAESPWFIGEFRIELALAVLLRPLHGDPRWAALAAAAPAA